MMHYLHKILVYIPDAIYGEIADTEKEELLESILSHAESETEVFYGDVFDWRETDCASRWNAQYPQQVYLASDDSDWFIKELEEVQSGQRREIDYYTSQLKDSVGVDLEQIVNGLWNQNNLYDRKNGYAEMTSYYLYKLASYLHGKYMSASCFYNTHDFTARLFNSDIERVRKAPQKWALVMFDYHN